MAAVLPISDARRLPPQVAEDNADIPNVTENDDGSATVDLDPPKGDNPEFYENLADVLDDSELGTIAHDLMTKIDYDKLARKERDEQYAEGLKRSGMSDESPGGASFTGASRAVHPMLAEAAVDFAASAMKELFPPDGPTKTKIYGDITQEKLDVADRQYKCMNWVLTDFMPEYPEELEQLLTQLPLGGSQFQKFWWDNLDNRICTEFVPVDDVIVPYACSDFWTAHRITHVMRLSESVWEDRVEAGMYIDVEAAGSSENPEQTEASKANERIEGKSEPMVNIDGVRLVYEVNCYLKISADKDERLPYLVSICESTNQICGLYRNWKEDDKKKKRLHWMVDWGFIQWRGAYKAGLVQLIGGLSAAATGVLRALLDSALISSLPMLAKIKGIKFSGQSKTINPTEAIEIDAGGTGIDDIRKALQPLPYPGPSPVLFTLLGWLTDAAKGVVTTAEEKIADAGNNMPMGTALALIEQGSKVFSSIHARLHRSQKKALKIVARILGDHLTEEIQKDALDGEVLALQEDFRKPLGVVPVSDPNIFSEGQRYAQMHLVEQFSQKYPQMHNLYEVVYQSYKLAKIQEIDKLLPKPKEPAEMNSVAENSSVMLGNPILAFPDQDHLAHLEVHFRFILDPILGGNPAVVPTSWPKMLEHIKQHLSFYYAKCMHDMVSSALGFDVGDALQDKKNWPKVDKLNAEASAGVHDVITKKLSFLGPEIDKVVKQVMSMKQPGPMDPSAAAVQVATMDDKRKRDEMTLKDGQEKAKLQQKGTTDQGDLAIKDGLLQVAEGELNLKGGVAEHDGQLGLAQHALAEANSAQAAAQAEHDRLVEQQRLQQQQQQQEHQQGLDVNGQQHDQAMDVHGAHIDQQGADVAAAQAEHAMQQPPPGSGNSGE